MTWIVHGPTQSISYQAHEQGFDVFMGNFRGVYPRKMAAHKDPKTYWDYNLDHFGKYDVAAFISKIHSLKVAELYEMLKAESHGVYSDEDIYKIIDQKLKITFIGHSLGGMVLPMYLIH